MKTHFTLFHSPRDRISKNPFLIGAYVMEGIYSPFHVSRFRSLDWVLMSKSGVLTQDIYIDNIYRFNSFYLKRFRFNVQI